MKTMTLSEVSKHLAELEKELGDIPMALYDLDTGWYFPLTSDNFEKQEMDDGSLRISLGLNSFTDQHEPEPKKRLV